MQMSIGQAEGQGKNAKQALHDLGLSATDAHGRTIPLRDILPQVVERLGGMESGGRKAADTMALFGRGGAALIITLNSMRQGFQAVEERARAMGVLIGKDDVEAAGVFLLAQRQMTAQMSALALAIGREVMPVVTQLFIRLENYPLLLEQLSLQVQKLEAYLLALPS
jgi:hypothetical protein